jgi:L-lactate dehydrogenase complex protein LldG
VTTAREEILARIRAANGAQPADGARSAAGAQPANAAGPDTGARPASDTPADRATVDAGYAAIPRDYARAHHDPADHDIVALFAERAADYRAVVERVPEAELAAAVARTLTARAPHPHMDVPDISRFVVPDGLPSAWVAKVPGKIELIADDPPMSPAELDKVAGVITGCAVAIAETGTIILDHGPGQGRRALTLVPDFHLVVVRAGQVAPDLPDAFARLDPVRPYTLISGPSATSDIELIRVEGVHGPRTLHILLAD